MDKPAPVKTEEPPPTDRQFVLRFLSGEEAAFERIVDRYQERVLAVCRRFARGEEAWDLWQETWVRAHANLGRWTEGEEIAPWLMRIGINVGRDHARKRRTWLRIFRPLALAGEPPAPDAAIPAEDPGVRSDRVRDAVARLPGRQREVIALRFFGELQIPVIARELGCSESTVKTHLYRGLAQLKNALGGLANE